MMAVPVRVLVFEKAALQVLWSRGAAPFRLRKFPEEGNKRDVERQINDCLQGVPPKLEDARFRLDVTLEGGTELPGLEFETKGGAFHEIRSVLVSALIARAFQHAEQLDGQNRDHLLPDVAHAKPFKHRHVAGGIYARTLRPATHQRPDSRCPACNRKYPELRGWEGLAPVGVRQVHRAHNQPTAEVCPDVLHQWRQLDARPLAPVTSPTPKVPPALMDRRRWLRTVLSTVPVHFGGPMLDQLPAFEALWP